MTAPASPSTLGPMTWFWVLNVLAPVALATWSRVRASTVIATILVTGAATLVMSKIVCDEPNNIGAYVLFFLLFGPGVAIPVAAKTAISLARPAKVDWCAPSFLALLGWGAGIGVMLTLDSAPHKVPLSTHLLAIAAPTIYCACGAVFAAGLRQRP